MSYGQRILHINLAKGWRGGEQQTWLLMEALSKRGVSQFFLGRRHSPLSRAAESLPRLTVLSKPFLFFNRHDVLPARLIVHAHEARAVQIAWWLNKRYGYRYVITRRMEKPPKPRPLTRRAYRGAAAHVGISTAACLSLKAYLPAAEPQQISSVHSSPAPDAEKSQAIRAELINQQQHLVGHAGALVDANKGQSLFIRTVIDLRNDGLSVAGVLMGEGPDREFLEGLASGAENLKLVGQIRDIHNYLSALDVFVFPSFHEGLGSVLLEVMMCNVPIVASSAGGIPDLVKHEETGLLVPSGDQAALTAAVKRVLEDSHLAKELTANAFELAKNKSPARMADEYQALYEEIGANPQ